MPRLLSINNYHYRRGGSDAVYFDHDRLFREMGWETAFFAMHHPKNFSSAWSDFFVDEIEFGHRYGPLQKAAMAGKVVWSREARTRLDRLLKRFSPDIAHAHCIYHHLSPSILPLLKQRGIPVVMTAHDLKLACPAYKMLNRGGVCERCRGGNLLHVVRHRCVRDSLAVSALVLVESLVHRGLGLYRRHLDRVIAPSRFFKAKLEEWGWPAEQVEYIANGIDVWSYTPEFRPGDYFVYFGRLAPEKGVATLIEAVRRVPGARLKIAGTGPEEEALRRQAAGCAERIEFVGYRAGFDLHRLVREARAAVLPSEWYENAPVSLLEAYALGKPVVGARIGGIPELVAEGRSGRLFAAGDVDDLAETIADLQAASASTLETMGREGRALAAAEFSRVRYRDEMSALYRRLAA